jgi:hypothetical protein
MDEKDLKKERQNGKRKECWIERHFVFFFGICIFLDKIVCRNGKARTENKALSTTLFLPLYFGFK